MGIPNLLPVPPREPAGGRVQARRRALERDWLRAGMHPGPGPSPVHPSPDSFRRIWGPLRAAAAQLGLYNLRLARCPPDPTRHEREVVTEEELGVPRTRGAS